MRCYFNLVSSHHTIIDEEGLEVADMEEAHTFAREAVREMVQDGIAEIAHWRGWQMEARDASGTVLFTMGFEAPLRRRPQQQAAESFQGGGLRLRQGGLTDPECGRSAQQTAPEKRKPLPKKLGEGLGTSGLHSPKPKTLTGYPRSCASGTCLQHTRT